MQKCRRNFVAFFFSNLVPVMQSISFSTKQTAQYLGVDPYILQSNHLRHGNYRGIVPRKGGNGRLLWPASEVRNASLPKSWELPEGMPLFIETVGKYCSAIDTRDVYRLGSLLLGSEALPGWEPVPGQGAREVVATELPLAMLILQATLERVAWALCNGGGDLVPGAADFLALLIRRMTPFATSDNTVNVNAGGQQ